MDQLRITNHGELLVGEIQEALKYDRPYQHTKLINGVRIITERYNTLINTVGIFIEIGSRHETFEKLGCAHLLESMNFKGTKEQE